MSDNDGANRNDHHHFFTLFMRPARLFYIFIGLLANIRHAESISLDGISEPSLNIPVVWQAVISHLINAVGGRDGFAAEMKNMVKEASRLRDNIPASLVDFRLSGTLIAKICFSDSVCWAAKVLDSFTQETLDGISALMMVHNYCPNIPVSQYKGCSSKKLNYCFTEWKEGKSLEEEVLGSINHRDETKIKIPENVITSLAEFVYNLTTCWIPENMSKKSIELNL
jgi:hypothetical protein